jgi:hypothetical protein
MPLNPLETTYSSGSTLYAVIHNPDGRIWNNVSMAWEAFNNAKWAEYAVPLTEQGSSGYYRADYPEGAAGLLSSDVVYNQAGVAPDTVDAPATGIGQSQGVDVAAIKTSVEAAENLKTTLDSETKGAITDLGTSTDSVLYTDLDDAIDVHQGRLLIMSSGDLLRAVANIASYNPTTHVLTLAGPLPGIPALADTFIIV